MSKLPVKSNVDEDEQRGDDYSCGECLAVVERLLEEHREREGASESESGEHGQGEEEVKEKRGAALVELWQRFKSNKYCGWLTA